MHTNVYWEAKDEGFARHSDALISQENALK